MRDIVIAAMVALLLAVLVYTAVDKLQPTRMPHLTPPEPELPPPTATLHGAAPADVDDIDDNDFREELAIAIDECSTIAKLQDILRERHLRVTGRKADLCTRVALSNPTCEPTQFRRMLGMRARDSAKKPTLCELLDAKAARLWIMDHGPRDVWAQLA